MYIQELEFGLQEDADHVLFSRLQVPCRACLVAAGTAILIVSIHSDETVSVVLVRCRQELPRRTGSSKHTARNGTTDLSHLDPAW